MRQNQVYIHLKASDMLIGNLFLTCPVNMSAALDPQSINFNKEPGPAVLNIQYNKDQ